MEKNPGKYSSKTLIYFSTEERKTWTSWMTMGVSKLSAFFLTYSFKISNLKRKKMVKQILLSGLKLD